METASKPSDPSNPNEPSEKAKGMGEQIAAYQKIWVETIGKLMQSAISLPPNSAPPEVLRQMRGGLFHGLGKSWDEFLRSPQFLEAMRQWMENAVIIRKMTNDFLTRTHHEMQGTAREDIDTVMLAVRHMEQRILDRLEKIEEQLAASSALKSNGRHGKAQAQRTPASRAGKRPARPAAKTPNPAKATI